MPFRLDVLREFHEMLGRRGLSPSVERINGVPNAASDSGPQQDRFPDFGRFRRVVELIHSVQDLGLGVVLPPASVSSVRPTGR